VIHKLLEEAGEGRFVGAGEDSIRHSWDEHIRSQEAAMQSSWLERHLVPLARSMPDFEVKQIQACARARDITDAREAAGDARDYRADRGTAAFELSVASHDGLVVGRIDAVLATPAGPVIRDYKSGAVLEATDGHLQLRHAYQTQVRLYAALYAESTGVWPIEAEVIPVLGARHEVGIEHELCRALLGEARLALVRVNKTIGEFSVHEANLEQALAKPAPATCAQCSFRPGCRAYRQHGSAAGNWPADIWGTLIEVRPLGNSTLILTVRRDNGETASVRGVTPGTGRHPGLAGLEPGNQVSAFNLRPTASPSTFTESRFSIIYREPSGYAGGAVAGGPGEEP
jgi:hypothetical protein